MVLTGHVAWGLWQCSWLSPLSCSSMPGQRAWLQIWTALLWLLRLLHEWGSSCGGGVLGGSRCTCELLPLEGKVSTSGGSFTLFLAGTLGSWGEEASHSAY